MRYLAVLLFSVFLSGMVATVVVAVDPPAAEAASGGYVTRCGGGKIFLNGKERETFYLHNKQRKSHNLKPFCVQPNLQKAARSHSKDMIRRDYFSHNTKGRNENACERIRRFGYRYRYCGENITWGPGYKGSPSVRMRAWMRSSAHRRNILNGKFREIGIGTYTGTFQGSRNATMYTADFGTRL